MSVRLQKGQKISLSKEAAGLANVLVGLGWDEVQQKRGFFAPKPQPIDCDAFAILLKNGKLGNSRDLIYYGNLVHFSDAVRHMGDNLTGAGDGDDEQILLELKKLPADYDRIVICVNIYEASLRKQHFGMIKNAFIRIVDGNSNRELCRYDLSENYDGKTAMIFGEVYKHNNEWKFNAIGQATNDHSINDVTARYL